MKYLKYFESKRILPLEFKYNVNDYIKLNNVDFETGEANIWRTSTICKIINKDSKTGSSPDYYIETYLLSTNEIFEFWIDEKEIERLATEEEIKKYNLIITTNKYNL